MESKNKIGRLIVTVFLGGMLSVVSLNSIVGPLTASDDELLYPTDDSYTDQRIPYENYGFATTIWAYYKPYPIDRYMWLKFDLTGISIVKSATFYLHLHSSEGTPSDCDRIRPGERDDGRGGRIGAGKGSPPEQVGGSNIRVPEPVGRFAQSFGVGVEVVRSVPGGDAPQPRGGNVSFSEDGNTGSNRRLEDPRLSTACHHGRVQR